LKNNRNYIFIKKILIFFLNKNILNFLKKSCEKNTPLIATSQHSQSRGIAVQGRLPHYRLESKAKAPLQQLNLVLVAMI